MSDGTVHPILAAQGEPGTEPLAKVRTGIGGIDYVLNGGLPEGRMTMVAGGPGTGKTLLGLEFLYHSAMEGEPGIFIGFEERAESLRQNARTLGWALAPLEEAGKLFLLDARVDPEVIISGEFSLKALLAIIEGQARAMGARRVVVDAVDVLLRLFDDPARERRELYLLNDWLNQHAITSVLTAKVSTEGGGRYEFLDFMANTVIYLDQRVLEQVSTRQLRVLKYRGSGFSRNEHPYIIGPSGIILVPIPAVELKYQALGPMVPSGHPELDVMLGGGYRRGSAVLISGTSGSGKTILACTFARAACARGERVLYIDFEESEAMLVGSVRSAGIDLQPCIESGHLKVLATAVESQGAEEHIIDAGRVMEAFQPDHVVLDAASSAERLGTPKVAFNYLVRLMGLCRNAGRMLLMPNLLSGGEVLEVVSGIGVSSLVDSVIYLRQQESEGELNRTVLVLKSRGAKHSNQAREFRLTDHGIEVLPPYVGTGARPTGIARQQQEAREAAEGRRLDQQIRAKEAEIAHLAAALEARAADSRATIAQARAELETMRIELEERERGRQVRLGMRRPERERHPGEGNHE